MDMAAAQSFRQGGAAGAPVACRARLRVLSPAEIAAPSFIAEWEQLVARASEPNPFFEPWFLLPSLEQWGAPGRVRIKAWFHEGRLAGLLPVVRSAHYYGHRLPHAASWVHANAFCGVPLVAAGLEEPFWRALLAHFDQFPARALLLHLPQLPADGPVDAALGRVLAASRRAHYRAAEERRALLAGALTAAAYLEAAISAKKRKELRRQHKRLAEQGVLAFERREGEAGLAEWIEEFLALEASGWKGKAGSALASTPETRALFTKALAGAAAAGRLERLALRLDGRAIAMLVNFITPPGATALRPLLTRPSRAFRPGCCSSLKTSPCSSARA